MQTLELKNQLINIINNSDDNALRTILKFVQSVEENKFEDSFSEDVLSLSDVQKQTLDNLREKHFSAETPSLSLDEMRNKFTERYGVSHKD